MLAEAENLVKHHENATAFLIDMQDKENVARLISQADLVVRFVTYLYFSGSSVIVDNAAE